MFGQAGSPASATAIMGFSLGTQDACRRALRRKTLPNAAGELVAVEPTVGRAR